MSLIGNKMLVKRRLLLVLSMALFSNINPAFSATQMPQHNPVPGGVATVYLSLESASRPKVQFGDRNVLVLQNNKKWVAVVGLHREILPGNYLLSIEPTDSSKTNQLFRVNPIPASKLGRIIELPESFSDLAFTAVELDERFSDNMDYPFSGPRSVDPVFKMNQIVKKGQYVPYGLIITDEEEPKMIDHSWVTYITKPKTRVTTPGPGVVEDIGIMESGNRFLIINHGMGFRSVISNIERIQVRTGEPIPSNKILGLTSGDIQGRVDWQLVLNRSNIDPLQFSSTP